MPHLKERHRAPQRTRRGSRRFSGLYSHCQRGRRHQGGPRSRSGVESLGFSVVRSPDRTTTPALRSSSTPNLRRSGRSRAARSAGSSRMSEAGGRKDHAAGGGATGLPANPNRWPTKVCSYRPLLGDHNARQRIHHGPPAGLENWRTLCTLPMVRHQSRQVKPFLIQRNRQGAKLHG